MRLSKQFSRAIGLARGASWEFTYRTDDDCVTASTHRRPRYRVPRVDRHSVLLSPAPPDTDIASTCLSAELYHDPSEACDGGIALVNSCIDADLSSSRLSASIRYTATRAR